LYSQRGNGDGEKKSEMEIKRYPPLFLPSEVPEPSSQSSDNEVVRVMMTADDVGHVPR
jgi:hypothetical protein